MPCEVDQSPPRTKERFGEPPSFGRGSERTSEAQVDGVVEILDPAGRDRGVREAEPLDRQLEEPHASAPGLDQGQVEEGESHGEDETRKSRSRAEIVRIPVGRFDHSAGPQAIQDMALSQARSIRACDHPCGDRSLEPESLELQKGARLRRGQRYAEVSGGSSKPGGILAMFHVKQNLDGGRCEATA